MMKLKKFERLPSGVMLFQYSVEHSTPGRDGTTLKSDLSLFVKDGGASWCEMTIKECGGFDQKYALTKMSSWLRRLADGIDSRTEMQIPV
jgi:hypothetical protein